MARFWQVTQPGQPRFNLDELLGRVFGRAQPEERIVAIDRPATGMGDLRVAEEAAQQERQGDLPYEIRAMQETAAQPSEYSLQNPLITLDRERLGMGDLRVAEAEQADTYTPPGESGMNISDILGQAYGEARDIGENAPEPEAPELLLSDEELEQQDESLTDLLARYQANEVTDVDLAAAGTPHITRDKVADSLRWIKAEKVRRLEQTIDEALETVQRQEMTAEDQQRARQRENAEQILIARGMEPAAAAAEALRLYPTNEQLLVQLAERRQPSGPSLLERLAQNVTPEMGLAGLGAAVPPLKTIGQALPQIGDWLGAAGGRLDVAQREGNLPLAAANVMPGMAAVGAAANTALSPENRQQLLDTLRDMPGATGDILPALLASNPTLAAIGKYAEQAGIAVPKITRNIGETLGNVAGAGAELGMRALSIDQPIAETATGALGLVGQKLLNAPFALRGDVLAKENIADWEKQRTEQYFTPEGNLDILKGVTSELESARAKFADLPVWAQMGGSMLLAPSTYIGLGTVARLGTRLTLGRNVAKSMKAFDTAVDLADNAAAVARVEAKTATEIADAARLAEKAKALRDLQPGLRAASDAMKSKLGIVGFKTGVVPDARMLMDTINMRLTPVTAEHAKKVGIDALDVHAASYTPREAPVGMSNAQAARRGQIGAGMQPTLATEMRLALGDLDPRRGLAQAAEEMRKVSDLNKNPIEWFKKKGNLLQRTPESARMRLRESHDTFLLAAMPLGKETAQGAAEGLEKWKNFIFAPDAPETIKAFGPMSMSIDGRTVGTIVRDELARRGALNPDNVRTAEEVFDALARVETKGEAVTHMQDIWDTAIRLRLPEPKRNPIQIAAAIVKQGVYAPMWLGTRPGYVLGNLMSNMWAVIDGGNPHPLAYAENIAYAEKYAVAGRIARDEDWIKREAARRYSTTHPTESQLAEVRMEAQSPKVRPDYFGLRHMGEGLGGTAEGETKGLMSRLAPFQHAASDIETRSGVGYWRLGHERGWRLFSDSLPVDELKAAGLSAEQITNLQKSSVNWVTFQDAVQDIERQMGVGLSTADAWRFQAPSWIGDLRRVGSMDKEADDLMAVVLNDKATEKDWLDAVAAARKRTLTMHLHTKPALRKKVEKKAEEMMSQAKKVDTSVPDDIADDLSGTKPGTPSAAPAGAAPAPAAPVSAAPAAQQGQAARTLTPEQVARVEANVAAGKFDPNRLKYIFDTKRPEAYTKLAEMLTLQDDLAEQLRAISDDEATAFLSQFQTETVGVSGALNTGVANAMDKHQMIGEDATSGMDWLNYLRGDPIRSERFLPWGRMRDDEYDALFSQAIDDADAVIVRMEDDFGRRASGAPAAPQTPPTAAPAAEAMPVPKAAEAPVTPEVPIAAAADKSALIKPGAGWKMHLNVPDSADDPLTKEIGAWLDERGVLYKVGRASGQEGKGMTVYVGKRADLENTAQSLQEQFGNRIPAPVGDVLIDDEPVVGNIWARFEITNIDKDFHQYGSKGIPYLNDDMRQTTIPGAKVDREAIRQRADTVLRQRYGDAYRLEAPPVQAAPTTIPKVAPAQDIEALAQKIARGDKNFTLDELQLQQNYPRELEAELQRIAAPAAPTPVAAVSDASPLPVAPTMTRGEIKEQLLKATNLPEDEIESTLILWDHHARVWAEQTGRPVEQWLPAHIAGAGKGGEIPEGALIQSVKNDQVIRAATEFLPDGRAFLHAFSSPDASTLVHETWHILRRDLSPDDMAVAERVAGVKAGQNHVWTRKQEEWFAKQGVEYVRTGVAPIPELQPIFEKFKVWLNDILSHLRGRGMKTSDEITALFDRQLALNPIERAARQTPIAAAENVAETAAAPLARKPIVVRVQEQVLRSGSIARDPIFAEKTDTGYDFYRVIDDKHEPFEPTPDDLRMAQVAFGDVGVDAFPIGTSVTTRSGLTGKVTAVDGNDLTLALDGGRTTQLDYRDLVPEQTAEARRGGIIRPIQRLYQTTPTGNAAAAAMGGPGGNVLLGVDGAAKEGAKQKARDARKALDAMRMIDPNKLPLPTGPDVQSALTRWASNTVQPWMATRAAVANDMGTAARDFAILNYRDRRNIDALLGMIAPFPFWQTRHMLNLALRVAQNPGIFNAFQRYQAAIDDAEKDLPPEYRGFIPLSKLTGLPMEDWFGTDIYTDPSYLVNPMQTLDQRLSRGQTATSRGTLAAQVMGLFGRPYPIYTTPTIPGMGGKSIVSAMTGTTPEAWQNTRFHPWSALVRYGTGGAVTDIGNALGQEWTSPINLLGQGPGTGVDIEQPFRTAGPLYTFLGGPILGVRPIGVTDDEIKEQLNTMLATRRAHPVTKMGLTATDIKEAAANKGSALWQEAERLAIAARGRYDTINPNAVETEMRTMKAESGGAITEADIAAATRDQTSPLWMQAQQRYLAREDRTRAGRLGVGAGFKMPPTAGQREVAAMEKARAAAYAQQPGDFGVAGEATMDMPREPLGVAGMKRYDRPGATAQSVFYEDYPWAGTQALANDIYDVRKTSLDVSAYYDKATPLWEKSRQLQDQIDDLKGKKDQASKDAVSALYDQKSALREQVEQIREGLGLEPLQVADTENKEYARLWPEDYRKVLDMRQRIDDLYTTYADDIALIGTVGDTEKARAAVKQGYAGLDKRNAAIEAEFAALAKDNIRLTEYERDEFARMKASREAREPYNRIFAAYENVPPGVRKYDLFSDEQRAGWQAFAEKGWKLDALTAEERANLDAYVGVALQQPEPSDDIKHEWAEARDKEDTYYRDIVGKYPGIMAIQAEYYSHPQGSAEQKAVLKAHPELADFWDDGKAFATANTTWAKWYRKADQRPIADQLAAAGDGSLEEKAKLQNQLWYQQEAIMFPNINAEWDKYNAQVAAGGGKKYTPTLQRWSYQRNLFGDQYPEWKRWYLDKGKDRQQPPTAAAATTTAPAAPQVTPATTQAAPELTRATSTSKSTGTFISTGHDPITGESQGYWQNPYVPGYLAWTQYPNGREPESMQDRLTRYYSGKTAQKVLGNAPPAKEKATTTPIEMAGARPRFWLPDDIAVQLFGKSVLTQLEEMYALPSSYRAAYVDSHSALKKYLKYVAAGPQ